MFMCKDILPLWMFMQCPEKAEGLIGSPGNEFTDSNEMLSVLRTETFSYIRTPRVLAETA